MGYLVETSGRVHLPEDLERQAVTVLEVRMAAKQGWFDADDPDQPVSSVSDLAAYAGADARREGEWLVLGTDEQGDPKWSEQASEFYRSLADFVREGEVHLRGEDEHVWAYLYRDGGVVQRGENGWDGTPGQLPGPDAFPAGGEPGREPSAGVAADIDEPPSPAPAPPPPTSEPAVDPSQFRYPGRQEPFAPPSPSPSGPVRPGDGPPPPPPYAGQDPSAPPPHPGYAEAPPPRASKLPPGWDPDKVAEAWQDPAPASSGRTFLMVMLLVGGVILIVGLALLVSGM